MCDFVSWVSCGVGFCIMGVVWCGVLFHGCRVVWGFVSWVSCDVRFCVVWCGVLRHGCRVMWGFVSWVSCGVGDVLCHGDMHRRVLRRGGSAPCGFSVYHVLLVFHTFTTTFTFR